MGTSLAALSSKFMAMSESQSNPWIEAGADDAFFGTFLQFSGNDGKFSFGKKGEEDYLDDGHELIANLLAVKHGHICWMEGKVKDEINYLIFDHPKLGDIDDLPAYGPYKKYADGSQDGWQEQVIFEFYSPELDKCFMFKASGTGKLRAARALVGAYGRKGVGKLGKDGLPMFPVIKIGANSFTIKDNPKAGVKYAPVFDIIDWEEMSTFADIFEGNGSEEEDDAANYEEPAKATKPAPAKPAPKAIAKPVEEPRAPSRRQAKEEIEDAISEDVTDEPEEEEEVAPAPSRRARVVHAEPQDDEDTAPAPSARASARGRRAANR